MTRTLLLALSLALLAPREASAQRSDAAPEAQTAPRGAARLEVKTHVPGADVFVDGQPIGMTPAPAPFSLSPGLHTIELRRPGYTTARADVTLQQGASREVTLEPYEDATSLPSMGGMLALRLTESEVLLTIDGHLRGIYAAPLRLPRGPHHLVAERENFQPCGSDFVIEPGRATTLALVLEPTPEYRARFVSGARSQRTWGLVSMVAGFAVTGAGAGLVITGGQASGGSANLRGDLGWPLLGVGTAGVVLGIILFAAADDPHRYDAAQPSASGASVAP
jgi:hypothetical protein